MSKEGAGMDPALLAVLANRFDAIVREMTTTLLRTGRSAVIAVARDFSCAIATGDDQLLAAAKAHQADIGNSIPSSYHPFARDVYEEGALIFSAAQVQRDYEDVDDVIRMCRRRIRVPEQWYGDYLAMLGAARIGERRLKEVVDKYGIATVRRFIAEWLDYSERRMTAAIEKLPKVTFEAEGAHDPVGPLTEGIPVRAKVAVDPAAGRIEVDLRDNVDAVPAGLNETMVCSINNAVAGVLNALEPGIPVNSGSFRRLEVKLREGAVIGIPVHPTSCSLATTNVADRLINVIQLAFSQIGEGHGLAEGGAVIGTGFSVIAGHDRRHDSPYINQLVVATNGGPGGPKADGWITYNAPGGAGLVYRNSIEIDEHKYPMLYRQLRLEPDSGGAGRHRGAPASTVEYGPTADPMSVAYSIDGWRGPARGARGGLPGSTGSAIQVDAAGVETEAPTTAQLTLQPGEFIRGHHGGGGGYGDPLTRAPSLVRDDLLEGYISPAAASDVYGVVFTGAVADHSLAVDESATAERRGKLAPRG